MTHMKDPAKKVKTNLDLHKKMKRMYKQIESTQQILEKRQEKVKIEDMMSLQKAVDSFQKQVYCLKLELIQFSSNVGLNLNEMQFAWNQDDFLVWKGSVQNERYIYHFSLSSLDLFFLKTEKVVWGILILLLLSVLVVVLYSLFF